MIDTVERDLRKRSIRVGKTVIFAVSGAIAIGEVADIRVNPKSGAKKYKVRVIRSNSLPVGHISEVSKVENLMRYPRGTDPLS